VKSAAPFTLADLRAGRAAHRPCAEAIRLMGIFGEVGSPEGYVVPVYGPFGYRGKVCYFGTVAAPPPAERMALRLLAIHVHDRLREMPETGVPGPLSRRELAVLRAARSGLGDEEIAACLGIGLRTVRFHFENARRKLGSRTRLQAVAEAVERGIL
jgi:DNA-binding CsgD family transcriptional regulator